MSRPMRARGLKLVSDLKVLFLLLVAPHAGAWIETLSHLVNHGSD